MSEPDFHPIASQYWADHLGISLERLFAQPLSIIAHGGELAGYGGVFALYFDFFKGLFEPRPSCWIVVAGPFVLLTLFRIFRLILRKI